MKKIIYTCDKCGKEINGAPIKLVPASYDAYGDVMEIESDDLGGKVLQLQRCDFCESCFSDICMQILPDQEELQEDEEGEEETPEALENKPKKGGKMTPLDTGKIKALFLAGWKAPQIAEELRCSEPAVYRHIRLMRERGEIA